MKILNFKIPVIASEHANIPINLSLFVAEIAKKVWWTDQALYNLKRLKTSLTVSNGPLRKLIV